MHGISRRSLLAGSAAIGGLTLAGLNQRLAWAAEGGPEVLTISPDLINRAKREGSLMVRYAAPVEVMSPIVDAFQKQFGITLQLDRKAGSLGNQQFATEERAGQHIMDVSWITDPIGLKKLSAEGFYLNWTIPDVEKKLPKVSYVPGWGYCPFWTDMIIPYNPDVVPHAKAREIFKTWHGFLDPSLTGKIGLVEPAATNAAFLTYMMFFELPQYGRGFFEKLAGQKPRLYAGSANGREDMASGAVGTFIPNQEFAAFNQFLSGDKAAWMCPEIAASTAENHVAVSKNAPHPAAARLFAAWVFSEEGTRAIQGGQARPTLIGAPEERSAVIKLKQTSWWSPRPLDATWAPDPDTWAAAYPTLMPEMRRILGWRG